jgi:hypothetical protein
MDFGVLVGNENTGIDGLPAVGALDELATGGAFYRTWLAAAPQDAASWNGSDACVRCPVLVPLALPMHATLRSYNAGVAAAVALFLLRQQLWVAGWTLQV